MSVIEVLRLPATEVTYWTAYFEVIRRENERHKPNNQGNRQRFRGPKSY